MANDDSAKRAEDATGISPSSAASRLSQISSHIDPETTKPNTRRKRRAAEVLPGDWSDIRGQLDHLRSIARTPPTEARSYIRQKTQGKLWARERLNQLLDRDTFGEVGSVSGTVTWINRNKAPKGTIEGEQEDIESFIPSNNIQGFGTINGRKVIVTADDFTIRAGHGDGAHISKTEYMEKLCLQMRLPMVKLVDGSSGGGSVTTIKTQGWSYIPWGWLFNDVTQQLDEGIPNIGCIVGPAIGLGAARVVSCHFVIMAADIGSLFNAGPKVVAEATFEEDLSFQELGGAMMHCTNGTCDNLAANEKEVFAQVASFLSYVPSSGYQIPPTIDSMDDPRRISPELRTIIPRKKNRSYQIRTIITTICDTGSFFEIGTLWGTTACVGLARMNGKPVGVIANDCLTNAGALDTLGSQKIARHLKLCDVFNLPIVQFIDVPGYAIGTAAERSAVMRWGVELMKAYFTTTIPLFTVIMRRAYGVAGSIMIDCRDPKTQVAWPSGDWGSLPLEGGIEVGHRQQFKDAKSDEERDALHKTLHAEYLNLQSPVRTANAFGVEEIIDPQDTRGVVVQWCDHIYDTILPERIIKRLTKQIRTSFR